MVVGFTTTCATTKVVSLNPAHGEICDMRCDRWFLLGTPVSSTNKTEILLKVHMALNIIILTSNPEYFTLQSNTCNSLQILKDNTMTKRKNTTHIL